jgi:hypothetical protein
MQQRRHGGQQDAQLAHVFQYSESEIVICRTSDVTFPTPHIQRPAPPPAASRAASTASRSTCSVQACVRDVASLATHSRR